MATIQDKKLTAALKKAENVGLVEEAFAIEGCQLVLRNLRPEEYTAALRECEGLDAAEYLVQFQKAHISRAIVEVNGADLRDVKFVETEEEDAKTGQAKKVKRELHQYLQEHLLASWGREAIYATMRKFYDAVEAAERRAKEGITFLIPDETAEEKYRRLLGEAQAVEKDVPPGMLEQILDELGLMRKSTQEEIQRAIDKVDKIEVPPQPEPDPAEPEPAAPAAKANGTAKSETKVVDPHVTLQHAIAARQVAGPEKRDTRSAQIEALEGFGPSDTPDLPAFGTQDPVEIRKQPAIDLKAAVIDQPPMSGINPRFRYPSKL